MTASPAAPPGGADLFGTRVRPDPPRTTDSQWPPSSTLAPALDKLSVETELIPGDWTMEAVDSFGVPDEMKVDGWTLFWEHELFERHKRTPTPGSPSYGGTTNRSGPTTLPQISVTPAVPEAGPPKRQLSPDTEEDSEAPTSPDTVLNTPDSACQLLLPPAWSAGPRPVGQIRKAAATTGAPDESSASLDDDEATLNEDTSSGSSPAISLTRYIDWGENNAQEDRPTLPALELLEDGCTPQEVDHTSPIVRSESNRPLWTPRLKRKTIQRDTPQATDSSEEGFIGSTATTRQRATQSRKGSSARPETDILASNLCQRQSKLESEKKTRQMFELPPLPTDDSEDELKFKPSERTPMHVEPVSRPPSPLRRAAWAKAQTQFPRPNERRMYTAKEDQLMLDLVRYPSLSETALQHIASGLKKEGYERTTSAIQFRLRNALKDRFAERCYELQAGRILYRGGGASETPAGSKQNPITRLSKRRRLESDM